MPFREEPELGLSTGRVCTQPGTDPSESGDKEMHPPPTTGVIGSSGSDHQRAAGGSVGVENPENGENKHMKTAKIRPKSSRFLQIRPNLGHFRQDLG